MKHILPRPLPESAPAPPAPVPPPALVPPTTMAAAAPPPPALSPMQYAVPPGSSLAKNDIRNTAIDRRKRRYVLLFTQSCSFNYASQFLVDSILSLLVVLMTLVPIPDLLIKEKIDGRINDLVSAGRKVNLNCFLKSQFGRNTQGDPVVHSPVVIQTVNGLKYHF